MHENNYLPQQKSIQTSVFHCKHLIVRKVFLGLNLSTQASINQMAGAGRLVQQALGSMLEILRQNVFNSTAVGYHASLASSSFPSSPLFLTILQVGDVIWGYDHPLIKLGNDVLPQEQKLPFNKFGFFVNVSSV